MTSNLIVLSGIFLPGASAETTKAGAALDNTQSEANVPGGDRSQLTFFRDAIELSTKKELQLQNLPQGQVTGLRWHNNNRDLAFNLENARTPSDVHSLNTATGAAERLTQSETGMANLNAASEGELFHFKSFDDKLRSNGQSGQGNRHSCMVFKSERRGAWLRQEDQ
jgi:hypothetical protein